MEIKEYFIEGNREIKIVYAKCEPKWNVNRRLKRKI
jgi:hypothetical protein